MNKHEDLSGDDKILSIEILINLLSRLEEEMSTITLKIGKMDCEHCVAKVQKTLLALPTVEKVSVNLKKGEAQVKSTITLDLKLAEAAIVEAGYVLEGTK